MRTHAHDGGPRWTLQARASRARQDAQHKGQSFAFRASRSRALAYAIAIADARNADAHTQANQKNATLIAKLRSKLESQAPTSAPAEPSGIATTQRAIIDDGNADDEHDGPSTPESPNGQNFDLKAESAAIAAAIESTPVSALTPRGPQAGATPATPADVATPGSVHADWLDSAKKELTKLEGSWDEIKNSPLAQSRYVAPSMSVIKRKALALQRQGFTTAPTPPPLKRMRGRQRGVAIATTLVQTVDPSPRLGDAAVSLSARLRPSPGGPGVLAGALLASPKPEVLKNVSNDVDEPGKRQGPKAAKVNRMKMAEQKFKLRQERALKRKSCYE